ncbi:MAG: DUF3549 family protein [Pseudomonadales bacterium]|nr:DUF3549 family protein [Pseudomonadales bacterium]NRA17644.1 DUF3549 family protein [Oceanospirillaceae bacterium]
MSSLNSLTALLQESGAQFRIYDMGRHIKKIGPQLFAQIERGQKKYPSPYLHHAWLALLLWNPKQKSQNVVWFLKFPLDEQGHLVQAVRDDFINRLMININQMLQSADLNEAEDALKDNPFSFTPDQEKMAMFHAITHREIGAEKSQYYPACQEYYAGKSGWENWHNLGLQGIAEVAVNIEENQILLLQHFNSVPEQPLIALCTCLEHVDIGHKLATIIQQKLQQSINQRQPDIALCTALLRATQAAPGNQSRTAAVKLVLESSIAVSAEVLSTIAIKASEQLKDPKILQLYLEKLAVGEAGQQGFSRILADLMFSEELRRDILQAFRQADRSAELSLAIGHMFGTKL